MVGNDFELWYNEMNHYVSSMQLTLRCSFVMPFQQPSMQVSWRALVLKQYLPMYHIATTNFNHLCYTEHMDPLKIIKNLANGRIN